MDKTRFSVECSERWCDDFTFVMAKDYASAIELVDEEGWAWDGQYFTCPICSARKVYENKPEFFDQRDLTQLFKAPKIRRVFYLHKPDLALRVDGVAAVSGLFLLSDGRKVERHLIHPFGAVFSEIE